MLAPNGLANYGFTFDNFGANPAATYGASITPTGSNGEGSWATALASSADIAADCYWLLVIVHTSSIAATSDRSQIMDIGVDPAGGTSYAAVISNIIVGDAGAVTTTGGGHHFLFPLYIKAGSSLSVRIQAANATPGTTRVAIKLFGRPDRPECVPVGQFSETIGTITNSGGQSFTPGNGADGGWQSLGTTAKAMWWWQLAFQVTNTAVTAEYCYIDLAYGDASNKIIIQRAQHGGTTSETASDMMKQNLSFLTAYCPVPAGSTIYVRGRANNAPDTGYNAVAIGIGG